MRCTRTRSYSPNRLNAATPPYQDPTLRLNFTRSHLAQRDMRREPTRSRLPQAGIRSSTRDRYNDARDFRTRTNRAVGNAGLVPSPQKARRGLQIDVRA